MSHADAPFRGDLAEAPDGTRAVWRQAPDGLRLRMMLCPLDGARGTVLMFPGRTEIVEKYGRTAGRLAQAGYASAAIDWRGQGLSDRMLDDPLIGHVTRFADYQHDVAAMLRVLDAEGFPRPYFLLAHSMGGAIGLRAVMDGLDVAAAAFSAPMWGIFMTAWMAPINTAMTLVLDTLGKGDVRAPTTPKRGYLLENAFENNNLTTDRGEWDYMFRQVDQVPELLLGGPSIHWVRRAVLECDALVKAPPRDLPMLAGYGNRESIVSIRAIRKRMDNWPGGQLVEVPGARHELLMETPERRAQFWDPMMALFAAQAGEHKSSVGDGTASLA